MKDALNFGIGAILGVIAFIYWNLGIFYYYFIFCPLAISIFIILNFTVKKW
jgi:hypothetical protein